MPHSSTAAEADTTSRATRLLFWVAGADERHMRGQRKEKVFFQLVGGSIVLTALSAAVGMLLFQRLSVPGDWLRDIAIALVWSLFIFWLDRWLVSHIDIGPLDAANDGSQPRKRGRFAGYAARMLLGLLLAFVISGPIVLAVFSPEIDQQLAATQNTDIAAEAAKIRSGADFVQRGQAIQNTLEAAETTEQDKNNAAAAAQVTLDEEINGTGGSRTQGCGQVCEQKEEALEQATDAQAVARTNAETARNEASAANAQLELDINGAIAASNETIKAGAGALARERALFTLLLAEPYLLLRWAAFSGLLLLVDLAPILFKLVGSRDRLHDYGVRRATAYQAVRVGKEDTIQQAADHAADEVDLLSITEQAKLSKENILLNQEIALVAARNQQELSVEQSSRQLELDRLDQALQLEYQTYVRRGQHAEMMSAAARQYGQFLPEAERQPSVDTQPPPNVTPRRPRSRPASPSPPSRSVNNRWVLLGPVPHADRGGAGRVELASDDRNPHSNDRFVVKLLPVSNDPEERKRAERHLRNEQKWAARANSASVAPILDAGDDPYYGLFLVTPLYPSTLARTLRMRDSRPTLEFGLRVTKQVLRGLVECHKNAAVVHLDIKPANIALDAGGDVALLDFGLAQAIVPGISLPSGPPDYTKWYAPPEQLRGEPSNWSDSACDVRAVCAVLYEILCGRPPLRYEASLRGLVDWTTGRENLARAGELSILLLTGIPIEPIELLPWLPRELSDFIMQGLDTDPARRAPGPHIAAKNALDALMTIENRISRPLRDHFVGAQVATFPGWASASGSAPAGGPAGPLPRPPGPPPDAGPGAPMAPPGTHSTAAESRKEDNL